MMYSEYKEKLQQLYKFQSRMFFAYGVYHIPKDTSKFKKLAYELYFAVIFLWLGTYDLCLLIEFYRRPTILDKIVKVFFGLATFIGSTAKLCSIKKNSTLFQELISFLSKDIFVPTNSLEYNTFEKNLALSKRVRKLYGLVSILALIYVLVLQKLNHPHELAIAAYTPFNIDNSLFFMIMADVYGFVSVASMCFINIAYDSWCTSFLIFVKSQLEILQHRLEGIGDNSLNYIIVNEELKRCIRHHSEVLKFVEKIEKVMIVPVSLQIFCSISVLCCNFYAMSITSIEDDVTMFTKFFVYQMAMLSQIFLLCYFSNEVTLTSLKLPYALYSSNWIMWDKSNRKLMLLIMLRFQKPIHVKSINSCYPFDLAAFTSIVNTSYSYFALLKQMN